MSERVPPSNDVVDEERVRRVAMQERAERAEAERDQLRAEAEAEGWGFDKAGWKQIADDFMEQRDQAWAERDQARAERDRYAQECSRLTTEANRLRFGLLALFDAHPDWRDEIVDDAIVAFRALPDEVQAEQTEERA